MQKKQIFPFLVIILVVLSLSIALYYKKENIVNLFEFALNINPQDIRDFINSFGIWSPIVFILIDILQTLFSIIPYSVIAISGGLLFGAAKGSVLSLIGAIIGSTLTFHIGKFLGRPIVEKIISKEKLDKLDKIFKKQRGVYIVLFLRIIPVIPFDFVGYIVGLSKMEFKDFIVATIVGLIPVTILYCYLGAKLFEGEVVLFLVAMLIILVAFIILYPRLRHFQID